MAVPATPTSTPDTAYFHSVYSKMLPPSAAGPIYHASAPGYAFTLGTIRGKHISFEGVPGVGKTTLMHSCAAAIELFGGHADAHEENADAEMLQQFFADPARNAFWFQMYKLRGRQMRAQANEHALLHGTRQDRTVMEDRDLPGDMAFAIYNHYKGFISDAQMHIYMKEATLTKFHAAFLTVMPCASPACLVQRVATRGNPSEILFYDEEYFRVMDACYRAALQICGCTYCVVDWDESVPGVGAPGNWHADKPMVPASKCMEVIEHAIAATYGENIMRIDAMRGAKSLVIATNGGIGLRTSDPESIVTETKRLVLKYSAERPRNIDDDDAGMVPNDTVPIRNGQRRTGYFALTNDQVMGGIDRSGPRSKDILDRFIVMMIDPNQETPAAHSNKATDDDDDDDDDDMPPLEAPTLSLEDAIKAYAGMMYVSGDPHGMASGNTRVADAADDDAADDSDDSDDSMPELFEMPLEDEVSGGKMFSDRFMHGI